MLNKLFLSHPHSIGEGYFQHMSVALRFAGTMFVASIACLVHAFLPACCVSTGSETIERLHRTMSARHRR